MGAETKYNAVQTPVEHHGRLAVIGNRLVNQYGEAVQLRGMSFFWSMAPEGLKYYNANVVNWLADDWKVNVVRAAMGINECWGPGYLYDGCGAGNKKRVVDVVDAAIAKWIYVIIDWHSHDAYQYTNLAINTNGKAIFVSEFGVCDSEGNGQIDTDEATIWLDFLDANNVSWVNWSVSDKAERASALMPDTSANGNWTDSNLTVSGAYIRAKLIAAPSS